MLYRYTIMAGLLAVSLLLIGCTTTNPRYALVSADLGRSYETTKFSQIVNPEASVTGLPIEDMEGPVADLVNKKRLDDFKVKAPPTPVINLNLGPGGK